MQSSSSRLDGAFRSAMNFNPDVPEVQKKSPCPKLTHPLSFYDGHLDRRLSLKNVRCVPSFLSDLAQSVDIALEKSSKDETGLPSVERHFPEPQHYIHFSKRIVAKDANDIGQIYRSSISRFSCKLASMLSLHPRAAQWSTAIYMNARTVSRYQEYYAIIEDYAPEILDSYEPVPDKAYSMVDKDAWMALSDDDRNLLEEMRERFPRMAVWQFFFACSDAEDALKHLDQLLAKEIFPEITPSTLVEQWAPTDIPLPLSPDAINTAWGTTISSWVSPCAVAKIDKALAPLTGNARALRRSNRLASKTKLVQPLRKPKQMVSPPLVESKSYWPTITISTHKRNLSIIDEEMATSLIQHAWTRAVERDSSFIVFHCGTFERIAFRHRSSQTLVLSNIIDVAQCNDPAYAHIQTGLFIAIIDDIRDRTRQLLAQEAKSRLAKRKGRILHSNNNKRPRTRRSVALEEARKEKYQQVIMAVCDGIANRDLALLRIQHGPYNSTSPSSFLRIENSGATVAPREKYKPHEYFRITVTSEIAYGSTGDVHAATIDFLGLNGKTVSFSHVVVKLASSAIQKKRLRHEFSVYSHLLSSNAQGIPCVFGLYEDVETETLALILEHAGLTLWDCRLPDKSNRLNIIISDLEKDAYLDALKTIHDAGVRHRDLRLENLTINHNGEPCIIDFDRAELDADEKSLEREKEKLLNVLEGRHEYRISRETTEEDPEGSESGRERSSSPGFRIGVLR